MKSAEVNISDVFTWIVHPDSPPIEKVDVIQPRLSSIATIHQSQAFTRTRSKDNCMSPINPEP